MTPNSAALHPALQPLARKHHTLRNRLSLAPMSRVSAHPDGRPTAEMLAY